MARVQGICGFETGRTDAGYSLNGNTVALTSGSARTGTYKLTDKKVVAGLGGSADITTGAGIPSAALFQIKCRFYFQPVTFPSVDGLVIGEVGGLGIRVEMNTTGQIRFNSTLTSAPAYSAQTIAGHWYMVRMRIQGYNKADTVVTSGRIRVLTEVYDTGLNGTDIPALLLSYSTPAQPDVAIVNISWDSGSGFYAINGDALQEMAGKITGFTLSLHNSSPGPCGLDVNGPFYNVFPSQTTAYGPACSGTPTNCCTATNGSITEVGLLNGLQVSLFLKSNGTFSPTSVTLSVGNNPTSGVMSTREINYDDIYWDIQDGADVPLEFVDEFPLSTYVQPYPVTAQGAFNDFIPASSPTLVDDIPMSDTNTVASSSATAKTSYQHAALATGAGNIAEHIRVYVRWGGSANLQSAILNSSGTGLLAVSMLNEIANNGDTADFPFEGPLEYLTAEEFNDIEYGLRIDNASLTNLHSVFIEVLTGTQIQVEPADAFHVDADMFPEALNPTVEDELTFATGTIGFRLANQGEEITVPTTWRLERLDIGPRHEEKA
jgi:hypothetical protein